jgi:DNA-binding NtrC family response regulator
MTPPITPREALMAIPHVAAVYWHDPDTRSVTDRPSAAPDPRWLVARRALVVDHDRHAADLIGALFELWGADVTIARSLEHARAVTAGTAFDVVTAEISMPDATATALWAALGGRRASRARRVLFVTADRSPAARRFMATTGQPILFKPCSAARLHDAVVRLLRAADRPRRRAPDRGGR